MNRIVYAVPYVPPAPPVDAWRGIAQRWESPDGSVWSLSGDAPSGIRLMPGVRGLTEPPREQFVDETAGVAGGRWRGHRDRVRDVFWPVSVWQDTDSEAWLDYDAAWSRSLDPDVPGRWVVTHPSGSERHLLVRFASDGNPAWDLAPGLLEWASYGITMLAVDPYWRGLTVTQSWSGGDAAPEDFVGHPLYISEGSTLATAEVTNPGDMTAHPVWWVQDVDAVDVTVAGQVIEVPAVGEDRLLVVDADPTALSAVEVDAPPATSPVTGAPMSDGEREAWVAERLPGGVDRTVELGAGTTWGALPARATTQVGIAMSGTGTVGVRFVPRYRRAW